MTPKKHSSIYDEVVRLAYQYFGSDSARHVGKFIGVHLRKEPETMTKDELVSMIEWIKNEANYMSEDKSTVENYVKDLLTLAERKNASDPS